MVLVFVVLGTTIAIKTPAYESGDEPGHVLNIETMVRGHWYSMDAHCPVGCSGNETQQAPLYYLLMAGWQHVVALPAHAPFRGTLNPGIYRGASELYLHHSAADDRFLLWLRLPNLALGGLTVLFTFFAVRLTTSDVWTPVIAASLVAFLPRFLFLSPFVTNDNLVDLLGAVLVFLALRYALAPGRWRMVVIGVVCGLLVTTKLSTLPLLLVIPIFACVVPGWRRRVGVAVLGLGTALMVSGWYLAQNLSRYGDPLALRASQHYLSLDGGLGTLFGEPYIVHDPLQLVFIQVPQRIIRTFWYQSGWNQFQWSWPFNVLFCIVTAGALAGLIHRGIKREVLLVLIAIGVVGLLCVWTTAFQTSTYQARYAYVGLAALAGLASMGLERWRLPIRFLLPAMGLIGTVIAIQQDVLAVHWT